jgi:predicted transcriptional regulator
MGIEDVLSSKGRIRVLKTLFRHGAVNINTIIRETGLTHRLVSKYIEEFKKEGLVTERQFGRFRIVELDYRNPKVSILKMLLEQP